MFQFTDTLLVGNAKIDAEHRVLFQILNEAQDELSNGHCPKEALIKMEEYLTAYAQTHFEHEEAFMRELNDPELAIQLMEHQRFREKVSDIVTHVVNEEDAYTQMVDLVKFVATWLIQHIVNSDSLIGKIPRITEENADDMFAFTSIYYTGIPSIDEQHAHLFDIIKRAYNTLHHSNDLSEIDRADQVLTIMDELCDYTKTHFAEEEAYMESIHYKGLDAQKKAHAAFIDKLDDVNIDSAMMDSDEYLDDIIDYLVYWLSSHIQKMDTLIPLK